MATGTSAPGTCDRSPAIPCASWWTTMRRPRTASGRSRKCTSACEEPMTTTLDRVATGQTQKQSTWQIDPAHTSVGFSVKHLMIARVRGRFAGVRGTIILDGSDLAKSWAQVEIDAATIDTRQTQRDAHLRSADFFEVET